MARMAWCRSSVRPFQVLSVSAAHAVTSWLTHHLPAADRSHIHTLSLSSSLQPLSAPLALLTPPPHALAPLAPYTLVLTPSQIHLLSPVFSAIVGSHALPSTSFTAARSIGAGKVAFVGRKADKWGVWVGEVGLDRSSGGVGAVMFTKEQTAKVLGPLHPATTNGPDESAVNANANGKRPASSASSSLGRARHFAALLKSSDWDALFALVADPSATAGLAASSFTALLSAVLAIPSFSDEARPQLADGTPVDLSSLLRPLVKVVRSDDGEWKSAFASLEPDEVVRLLAVVGGWVAELGDVQKEAQWSDVGKGLPSLAEVRPALLLSSPCISIVGLELTAIQRSRTAARPDPHPVARHAPLLAPLRLPRAHAPPRTLARPPAAHQDAARARQHRRGRRWCAAGVPRWRAGEGEGEEGRRWWRRRWRRRRRRRRPAEEGRKG